MRPLPDPRRSDVAPAGISGRYNVLKLSMQGKGGGPLMDGGEP